MNRTPSFSLHPGVAVRRPSMASRLSFAVSNAEEGEAAGAVPGEALIEEEIAEIKRYEVSQLISSM